MQIILPILLLLLTVALLAAAIYAQCRLGQQATSINRVWLARLVLIVAGLALGYVMTFYYVRMEGSAAVITFLFAFGLAHVPAALVLWVKRQRGEIG